jgi:hypothetical protein
MNKAKFLSLFQKKKNQNQHGNLGRAELQILFCLVNLEPPAHLSHYSATHRAKLRIHTRTFGAFVPRISLRTQDLFFSGVSLLLALILCCLSFHVLVPTFSMCDFFFRRISDYLFCLGCPFAGPPAREQLKVTHIAMVA